MNRIDGKIIFMTGATSGLGKIAAIKAAAAGAEVWVMARSESKAEQLKESLKEKHPNAKGAFNFVFGNLNSFESTIVAASELKRQVPRLDQLILNAGIMNFDHSQSADKVEETLQVNLLAPVLLTDLLFEELKKSNPAKVIITASGLHQGDIQFDDLQMKENFSMVAAYRQSKLGVILFARLMADKLKDQGIQFYTQHPGVVRTELARDAGWFAKMFFWLIGKSPEKGASTLVHLMKTPVSELENGAYYAKKRVTKTTPQSYDLDKAAALIKQLPEFWQEHYKVSSPVFQ